jgi:diadenosine tetraphosphate (Ap4A) HIT family hydrolase
MLKLVIPKFHAALLHEISDENLADILPVARKILLACFGDNGASIIPPYNILQNNGRLAHQVYGRWKMIWKLNVFLGS